MKCSECKKKIESCDMCGNVFRISEFVICAEDEEHYCSYDCLLESLGVEWLEGEVKG